MKQTIWLCCILAVTACLTAQQATNNPVASGTASSGNTPPPLPVSDAAAPALPAPAPAIVSTNSSASGAGRTNSATAKKSGKKAGKKAPAPGKKAAPKVSTAPGFETRSTPLLAGPASVIASNVNVRGQAKLKSEIVTHLNKGDTVSVLEEVVLKKSAADEPSAWAKIILPAGTHVWVNAQFVDETGKSVKSAKLNIRSGPGENYSVLGVMKKGDDIKEVGRKEDWLEIEAPAQAAAFVAAQYLKQEPASTTVASLTPPVADTNTLAAPPGLPSSVSEPPTVLPAIPETANNSTNAPSTVAAVPPAISDTNAGFATASEIVTNTPPPPPRIVAREGVVRSTFSIQAPTHFELVSPQNHRAINYLHATSADLDLSRYKGMHIIVTGEESLDERWGNTPVITVQAIQVLE